MNAKLCILTAAAVSSLGLPARGAPAITRQPTNQTVMVGSPVVFSVGISGSGPFTYQWQFKGTNLPNSIITTVAGGGVGDGGAATNAALNYAQGVAADAAGNLFIADTSNHRIRKVAASGLITSVAGTGLAGYSGDGDAATDALLNNPSAVAVDALGNLFIADAGNHCVRKVGTNGIITTIAGNGYFPGNFFGDGGPAIYSRLNSPMDLACGPAGALFIADAYNQRIRKVDTNGIITTVAGRGSISYSGNGGAATNAELNYPRGLFVTASGIVYIADSNNNRVRKVDTNGIITTVAGNGTFGFSGDGAAAINAKLAAPFRVVLDSLGNLLIADSFNHRVRKVNTSGTISTVAGNGTNSFSGDTGPATTAGLNYPYGLAAGTSGTFFIADTDNHRIRKVAGGTITTVAGSGGQGGYTGDGGAATGAMLHSPDDVAVDAFGNLFVSDRDNHRIREISTNGIISTLAGNGTNAFSGNGAAATNASLNAPAGLRFDASGSLFVADALNHRIRKIDTSGIITTVAGNGTNAFSGDGGAATNASLNSPSAIAFAPSGSLLIADTQNHRVRQVATNGVITTVAGNGVWGSFSGDGGPATNATVSFPDGVAVDARGNLFVSEGGGDRIRKVSTNGVITTVAGNGYPTYSGDGAAATNASLYFPGNIFLDATGNLFIVDTANNRIRKVDTNGIITTFAGGGGWVYSGENMPATNASLNFPYGAAFDAYGNLFIADTGDHRIRKVGFTGYPTLVLNNVTTNNAGDYTVVVTDPGGSVTSSNATLTVMTAPPPVLLTGPSNQVVVAGSAITLAVTVAGTGPFTYQWQFNGVNLPNDIISTVAGNGSGSFSGDGGLATNASLNAPATVALDAAGNLFLADFWNNRVRKVTPAGIITTVAGNGIGDFSGDGGAATNASLNAPYALAVAPSGSLCVADLSNHRIRKVTPDGIITTVAGSGTNGFAGDGGAATNAMLYDPEGLTFDRSGNLFIADTSNNRIRKVDTNGAITTFAGNGSGAPFSGAYSGDGGPATNASLYLPIGLAFDPSGNLFIADYRNHRIRKVDTNGIITTVIGTNTAGSSGDGGPAASALLKNPIGVAVDNAGNLFVADYLDHRIREVNPDGLIWTVAGNGSPAGGGDDGPAASASLDYPNGVATDPDGNLLIADYGNYRVRKVAIFGGYPLLSTFRLNNVTPAKAGNYTCIITGPSGVLVGSASLTVLVRPSISAIIHQPNGSVTLNFAGGAGETYLVQTTTNLAPPIAWQTVHTNIAGGDGTWQWTDANASTHPIRFYRSSTP